METKDRKVLFHCPTTSMEEFRKVARIAAESGATHVYVSDLPKSRWQWELDLNDPYPNWGMMHSSIFKVIVPEALKQWIPEAYANENLRIIQERSEILKEYGLKAAFKGCEPGWMIEDVYKAHPDWRGARCDHPRRSRKPYYSMCIDNQEVLDMYRDAVKKLCSTTAIEFFTFLTNDSGGGICWSRGLYPGQNGPSHCKNITFADRVTKFLSTLQQGALNSGVITEIEIGGSIPQFEVDSIIPLLKEGQSVNGYNMFGKAAQYNVGYADDFYANDVYPVKGIPHVVKFSEQCQKAFTHPTEKMTVSFQSAEEDVMFELFKYYKEKQPNTYLKRVELLYDLAEKEVGKQNADILVNVWNAISEYKDSINPIHEGGPILMLGSVNQRWLTRPLVPKPLELTEEERMYYRKFQFQANSEEEAADLMDLQAARLISGHSAAFITGNMMGNSLTAINRAINGLQEIINNPTLEEAKSRYGLLQLRLKSLVCVVKNAINTVRFQEILDRTDFNQGKVETPIWHVPSDQRLLDLQNILRDEIDNTYKLIKLMESTDSNLFILADTPETEDVFLLSSNIVDQLKKKAEIMVDHTYDLSEIYFRFN